MCSSADYCLGYCDDDDDDEDGSKYDDEEDGSKERIINVQVRLSS